MADERDYSPAVLRKARAAVDDGKVSQDPEHAEVFWVEGSTGTRYRVQWGNGWTSCTCPHGQNNLGTPACYHVAATGILVNEAR